MNAPAWFEWRGETLYLELHLQPRARHDAVSGLHGRRLKVRITAPPVAGKANAQLCAWLARQFGVAKSRVRILKGDLGRDKRVGIVKPTREPDWFTRLRTENGT